MSSSSGLLNDLERKLSLVKQVQQSDISRGMIVEIQQTIKHVKAIDKLNSERLNDYYLNSVVPTIKRTDAFIR